MEGATVTERQASGPVYRPPSQVAVRLALDVLGPLRDQELKHAPPILHLAGDASLLGDMPRVSIVGSRSASPEGIRRAARLATLLARRGVVVVSGLAKGIDRAAHEAAIAAGGRTIAVLGTPLDRCYPAQHARLQEQIYSSHLLVTQYSPGHRTHKSDFVERNRTMALLSQASVIVEAGDGSGTLSQAAETQRLGRPLFLMRSLLDNKALTWPARFLEAPVPAIVLEEDAQILEAVGR